MTRKHAKHRSRPGLHPFDAIAACQPFPASEITRILVKVHDAFAQLRNGSADIDLFDRLAAVLNVGLIRSEGIGQAGVDVFKRAQAALMEADAIYGRHKHFGFTGPGLEAMKEAIALYEEILKASTPRQMATAQDECMRRVRAGQIEWAQAATAAMEGRS